MSKLLLICPRRPGTRPVTEDDVRRLAARILPDNIRPNPPAVTTEHGVLTAVLNPVESVATHGAGACLGRPIDLADDWWTPGSPAPDGTFALFRVDRNTVELRTNILASRNIWYARTDDLFVASSSQRAIVSVLRGFRLDPRVLPWFLCTGATGPGLSWDRRIRFLGPDGTLTLDRGRWTTRLDEPDVTFEPDPAPADEHLARLHEALDETFRRLPLDPQRWLLPLSGGFDSRAILLFLVKHGLRPACATWGLAVWEGRPNTDLAVAAELAAHFGLEHRYYHIDPNAATVDEFLDRFITLCDGRYDGVEAYVDGFQTWKTFFEEGAAGVIRGEQAFGEPPVHTEPDARIDRNLGLFSDYANLGDPADYGLEEPVLPDRLSRRTGESLATWRDRLYQDYTMPYVFGALNELKACYVETLDPLTSGRIVRQVRTLPDKLRDDKALFCDLVRAITPDIGFPRHAVVPHPWDVMRTREVVERVTDELENGPARSLLSDRLVDRIIAGVDVRHEAVPRRRTVWRDRIKRVIPQAVRKKLRSSVIKPSMDWNVLAFRAYVISRMSRILDQDADLLPRNP